jgi:DNA-directed RNA polymerase specialized sigma24 family protein
VTSLRHPHQVTRAIKRCSLQSPVAQPVPARCELEGTAAKLHKLPEPGRSALALLYLDALPASDIQHVLNLDERLLADAVDKTRSALRAQRAMAT